MSKDGKIRIIEAAQRIDRGEGGWKKLPCGISPLKPAITTGAIYYYYKSKEELLYDVMDYASAVTSEIMKMRAPAGSQTG